MNSKYLANDDSSFHILSKLKNKLDISFIFQKDIVIILFLFLLNTNNLKLVAYQLILTMQMGT